MKVRNGFVSNSSSSSFILGLNKESYNLKELMFELYPDMENNVGSHYEYSDDGDVDCFTATSSIISKFQEQKPALFGTPEADSMILPLIEGSWPIYEESEKDPRYIKQANKLEKIQSEIKKVTGKCWSEIRTTHPGLYKKFEDQRDVTYEVKRIIRNELSHKHIKNLEQKFKGKYIYITSHSDNDGSVESALEHGDTYRNVPHETISQH